MLSIILFALIFSVLCIGNYNNTTIEINQEVDDELIADLKTNLTDDFNSFEEIMKRHTTQTDKHEIITQTDDDRTLIMKSNYKIRDLKKYIKEHNLQEQFRKTNQKSYGLATKDELIKFIF